MYTPGNSFIKGKLVSENWVGGSLIGLQCTHSVTSVKVRFLLPAPN
jgi:hypothetical protein